MERDLAALTERIVQLEVRARRQRLALGIAAVAAVGALAAGFAPPPDQHLVVRELSVVDGEGRVRVTLWAEGDEAGVRLFDQAGTLRTRLLGGDEESVLTFFDERGEERTVLTQGFNDHGLYLQGPDGHDRVALAALDDESDLGLHLMNASGERLALVATPADEGLFFRDDRGLFVVREAEAESLRLVTER